MFAIKYITWLVCAATVLHSKGNAQETAQPGLLEEALYKAFKTKNAKLLQPFLAPNFSVGVYTRPGVGRMLQNIIEHYPLDSLSLQSTDTWRGEKRMSFILFSKNRSFTTHAYLNEKNEIRYVDWFDRLYGVDKYQPSVLRAIIPFQLVNGSIVVTATLNKSFRPLRLLFDTGADGMALNRSLADSLGLVISREQTTSVVGGAMNVSISEGNVLHFDTLMIPGNNIALFDHIGRGYDGILGNGIATRYIIKVDFDKQVMELYNMGNYEFEKEGTTIDISFPSGVPVMPVSVKIGKKEAEGNFVFDSGANYYLIAFSSFVKKNLLLTNGFVPYFAASTVSMGKATPSYTGNFEKMQTGDMGLQDFPGVLQASGASQENGMSVSGSFGIKAMRRFNFTLHLGRQTIHFKPNSNYRLPVDFVIDGLVFSFISNSQLIVSQTANQEMGDTIREGDIITSINKISAEELAKHPRKIKQLQLDSDRKKYTIQLVRDGVTQKITL